MSMTDDTPDRDEDDHAIEMFYSSLHARTKEFALRKALEWHDGTANSNAMGATTLASHVVQTARIFEAYLTGEYDDVAPGAAN